MRWHELVRPSLIRLLIVCVITAVAACRGDILGVAPPASASSGTQLGDSAGAEALEAGASGLFGQSVLGQLGAIHFGGVMTDETFEGALIQASLAVDARSIATGGPTQYDGSYTDLQKSRIQAAQAIAVLEQHHTSVSDSEVAGLFALIGYTRVLLGETMCSGIPFGTVSRAGQLTFGDPLPTDSVFALAVTDFDSALAHATVTPTIASLASMGKGRALLNRGLYAAAGAAVSTVPAAFVYNTQLVNQQVSVYEVMATSPFYPTVADRKGVNGLDYVSARDPRMPTTTLGLTSLGVPWIYPLKFPLNATTNDPVPLADGVEAGLITAEAALSVHDVTGWLAALNTLRANFVAVRGSYPPDTSYHHLQPLSDPGADSARVDLLFRERAFWLYGTLHRLGDLRRLIRQYGRGSESVFPTGAYINGTASTLFPSYGTNVNFPLGAVEQGNPKFHGCLTLGA
jgi:hypothetical protein